MYLIFNYLLVYIRFTWITEHLLNNVFGFT